MRWDDILKVKNFWEMCIAFSILIASWWGSYFLSGIISWEEVIESQMDQHTAELKRGNELKAETNELLSDILLQLNCIK